MSLAFPRDCLAFHKARSFGRARSLAERPSIDIAECLREYMVGAGKRHPEVLALTFYGLNHAVAEISKRFGPYDKLPPLEHQIVETYYRESIQIGLRCFYYLLMITTREARHLQNHETMTLKLKSKYGEDLMNYVSCIPDDADNAVKKFTSQPPPGQIGAYVNALENVFNKGSWGHAYGGKAWGKVTACLRSFVMGQTSMEAMVDTVWTLAHNNGPIWNKSYLFHCHTNGLLRLLDIQASGQIPNAILHPYDNRVDHVLEGTAERVPKEIRELLAEFAEQVPEFNTMVDWFKARALGGKTNLSNLMYSQKKEYGPSPWEAQAGQAPPPSQHTEYDDEDYSSDESSDDESGSKIIVLAPNLQYEALEIERAA